MEGTTMPEALTALQVPVQTIPVPTTISPQAQAFLSGAAKRLASGASASTPEQMQAGIDAAFVSYRSQAAGFKGEMQTIELDHGAKFYRVIPEGLDAARRDLTYFDIHGGSWSLGGGEMCQLLAKLRALEYGVEVWSVDYRLAPEHPYPAALEDCMAAYRHVLTVRKPGKIVVAGGSAGGNLAAAMLLPAGVVLMTPAMDLTGAGDTRQTNRFIDVTLYGGSSAGSRAYAGKSDPTDIYLSPIYGDYSKGWPPTLLSSGTRDVLLSDTVRMHRILRQLGIRAELHVFEAAPHGGFLGTAPEDHELTVECRRFCEEIWKVAG
jgi:acetyl esterase/lipase